MEQDFLFKLLQPLKRRMHLYMAIEGLLYCVATAGAVSVAFAVVSRFVVVPFVQMKLLYILAGSLVAALFLALFLSPRRKKVIITADSLGLNERMITAWYLRRDTSPVARLQRQDTQNALQKIDFRKQYRPQIAKKRCIVSAALMVIAFAISFLPGRVYQETQLRESLMVEMKEQEKLLEEKVKAQIEEHPEMTAEQLEKLKEALERLTDAFDRAKNEEDALKALAQLENQMERLQKGDPLADRKALGNALADSQLTESLAEAMEKNEEQNLNEALEELKEEITAIDARQELAEILEAALKNTTEGSLMDESLQTLASAAAIGNMSASELTQRLSEMIENAGKNAQSSQSFQQAAGQVGKASGNARRAIASVDKQVAQGEGNRSGASAEGQGGQQGSQGSQQGSQGGQGSQPGNGMGGSQGRGQSSGAGAGEGSTGEEAGYHEGDLPGPGRAPGQRKENEYQRIYVPERLGGEGNETALSGQKLESGSSTFSETDGAPVKKGVMLPFDEILSEYRQQAVQTMDRQEIPSGMKRLVRDYFSSLE